MRTKNFYFTIAIAAMLLLTGVSTVTAQQRAYRVSDRQVSTLLNRIEQRSDNFRRQMNTALDRNRYRGQLPASTVEQYIEDFEQATDRLRSRFNSNVSVAADVQDVLNRAYYIDQFIITNTTLAPAARNQWNLLKQDLNTLAGYYNVSWNWQLADNRPGWNMGRQMPAYSATDAQMRTLLTRIESKTDVYKRQMDNALTRSRWNNTNREERIEDMIDGFENSTDRLKQRFDARESVIQDANDVLMQAAYIDRFMRNNTFTRPAQNQWNSIRTDLNTLANYYRVSWNWNQQLPPYQPYQWGTTPGGAWGNARLTGTYRLNHQASDNVATVVRQAIGNYNANQRTRVQQNLERRLNSPEMIAIDHNGRNVTMASTLAPQVTFAADGVSRTETGPGGQSISTAATLRGNNLEVSYTGDRARDFYVTFTPMANGDLRVSRRIYLENRNEMITVNSVYNRVAPVARWNDVNVNQYPGQYPGQNTGINAGTFIIPNGTRLTTVLRTPITTKASQVNDRFAMEVTSPGQYRGAVIEGYVVALDNSGRLTGRANVTLDFDTIRLSNGQTYRFAGLINSVRDHDGDNISVTNEGTLREGSRTTETVTRGGIGAALGAILGAVLGGGEGAAIGAGVGAGAGVGSVLLGGRDDLELQVGSQFDLTASSPANLGINRP
jgi:hypothetical protein